jgi:hypothetical protein
VTAFASVLTPFSYGPVIELGNRTWAKRILPIGEIEYQGRTLRFTRAYLQGLVNAWQQRAYDAVPLQFADAANAHTNDPERTRGWVTGMELAEDGLYVTAEMSDRGSQVLRENPQLGVSARIVEQYQRSDGAFFPAAIQHVLATLDPRIPGLGAWQPVDMSNGGGVTIDLSASRWPGEPALELAGDVLTAAELADLEAAISEAEMEALMQEGYDPGFTEFDAAFNARAAAEQARQEAIAAAVVEDTLFPLRRQEDKLARAMHRAADGVYSGQQLSFASESSAVELAMATGRGICGVPDEFGRCGSRFHDLQCAHGTGVDWLASGPNPQTYATSLANWAGGLNLSRTPAVYGDSDDDEPPAAIPAATIELAAELAGSLGLDIDAPWIGAPGFDDVSSLFRPPGAPVSAYDALAEGIGMGSAQPAAPSYPGISQLARDLGLK